MTARPAPLTPDPQQPWTFTEHNPWTDDELRQLGNMSSFALIVYGENAYSCHGRWMTTLLATRAQLAAVTLERNEAATSSNHLRLVLAQSLTAWEPKHNHAGGTDDCMVCVARGALDATKHFDFALSPTQPTPTEGNES